MKTESNHIAKGKTRKREKNESENEAKKKVLYLTDKNLGTSNTSTNISVNDPRFQFRVFSVLITIISTIQIRKPKQLSLVYSSTGKS
jgi:hypothetical protein